MTFPTITGKTINGAKRTLPQDFAGRYNVVLLAFIQEHQRDVNTWLPFLDELKATQPDVEVYELPTMARFFIAKRWMINYGMYMGIPDPDVRNRTITLYTDVHALLNALHLNGTSTIYVLLMDNQGTVYWQTSGVIDAGKADALSTALHQLKTGQVSSGA